MSIETNDKGNSRVTSHLVKSYCCLWDSHLIFVLFCFVFTVSPDTVQCGHEHNNTGTMVERCMVEWWDGLVEDCRYKWFGQAWHWCILILEIGMYLHRAPMQQQDLIFDLTRWSQCYHTCLYCQFFYWNWRSSHFSSINDNANNYDNIGINRMESFMFAHCNNR